MSRLWFVLWSSLLISHALAQTKSDAKNEIRFDDITSKTGIDFLHTDGGTGKHYIVETICSGLAIFDFDGDGLMDIYLLNGAFHEGTKPENHPTNRLYRNMGDWRFVDVTESAGVGDTSHSLGATVGDFDNDGDADLYVSNYGPKVFYRNNGDGTFTSVKGAPGTADNRVGAGVSFLDIDADGDLDLYVANYIKFTYDKDVSRLIFGIAAAPGPKDYEPDNHQLFRNNGDGSFTDISIESGIGQSPGAGMGIISLDFDRDGDTDLFICNDSAENFLWENDGTGKFTEIGLLAGVAYDYAGLRQASMGVDCADIDHDGFLDLVSTNFQDEIPNVYRNSEGKFFDDLCVSYGLGVATRSVKWGVGLSDFDNDSFVDLFLACGHLIDTVGLLDNSVQFATRNFLLRNLDGKRFVDVSSTAGNGLKIEKASRALGCEDLDQDGDLDVVILNLNSTADILRNDTASRDMHWIELRMVGQTSNRDAVGSQVKVHTKNGEQIQEVHRGRGYQSHYGNDLHFGLGNADAIDFVEVQWHGCTKEIFRDVPVDRKSTLIQGRESK